MSRLVLLVLLLTSVATAQSAVSLKGVYFGIYGGGGSSNRAHLSQRGLAFYPPTSSVGGTLFVNAEGKAYNNTNAFAGLHLGYEWQRQCSNWDLVPAVEIEGTYFENTQKAAALNPTEKIVQHTFELTLPMRTSVILANSVINFKSCYFGMFTPYFGGGLGAAFVSINKARSCQVIPAEPDVNHFNSKTHSSCWTFAAQAKVGARYCLTQNCRLFAEYRYLYISPTNYIFGSTQYPNHVTTTDWRVHSGNIHYNMGVWGIEFIL